MDPAACAHLLVAFGTLGLKQCTTVFSRHICTTRHPYLNINDDACDVRRLANRAAREATYLSSMR